ncbi:MAG: hypothetical protein HQ446_14740, partial [Polaromonas sp.]|nr:hypothetical protein [Polaromonas sp.]
KNKIKLNLIKISQLKRELTGMGVRPIKNETKDIPVFFQSAYRPFPTGFVFYLGALTVFSSSWFALGFICIFIIIVGYFANESIANLDEKFVQINLPFENFEKQISTLESDLKKYGYDSFDANWSTGNSSSNAEHGNSSNRTVLSRGSVITDSRGFEKSARVVGRRAGE